MVELTWVLDPEIVIPSPSAAAGAIFWERMLSRAADHRPRLGPATMRALGEIADSPPSPMLLAERDFWAILGQFMSRPLPVTTSVRDVCEPHLMVEYSPDLGEAANGQRLIEDLRSAGDRNRLILSSTAGCWARESHTCAQCESSRLHIIHSSSDTRASGIPVARAWRDAYLSENADIRELPGLAERMFPLLEFHPNAWDRVSSLVGPPEENAPLLVHHLGVLNDETPHIWAQCSTRDERQATMAALGVSCSPDSPQTHRNKAAMRERDFAFGEQVVRCEWHTKLRPTTNRIHFNADGSTVRIGTIVDHLTI